jgi:acetylornithine deacetylase/succinyl-diaminopimelate desuccinylase-like protein
MTELLDRDRVSRFVERERDNYESLLKALVEIPTVSSEADRRSDVEAGVALAQRLLADAGARVTIARTKGNPVVHGVLKGKPGAPAVTVYNHLDVQPASRETEPWETEPFRLVQKGDRYYGRGSTDDKGPALCAFFGALAAREAGVPTEIRFLWEFEEEIGSPNFEQGLRALGKEAATDSGSTAGIPPRPPGCGGCRASSSSSRPAGRKLTPARPAAPPAIRSASWRSS